MIYPPLPHQIKPLEAGYQLLVSRGFAAYYDFYMGLGKTYISLSQYQQLNTTGLARHCLVICPKTVVSNWFDEITKHLEPGACASVLAWDSTKSKGVRYQSAFQDLLAAGSGALLVNVEAFQLENPVLAAMLKQLAPTALVVLDEAVKVKDSSTARVKRLFTLTDKARYKIGLSGRSITESPLDLYSMYRFFSPRFWQFKSFFQFKQFFAILEDSYGAEGRTFKKVVGFQRLEVLRKIIDPVTISGRVEDSGLNLPEKIDAPLLFDLGAEESRVYSDLKKHLRTTLENGETISKTAKIALYATFRMVTGGWASTTEPIQPGKIPSKLAALLSDLEDVSGNVIITCEFRHEISQVSAALSDLGTVVTLTGQNSDKTNELSKSLFQAGEARFLVADTGMVARGLNLQAHCHLMYDYSITPSADEYDQHRARIHRIGQTKTCIYKQLKARGTVDERLHELVTKKLSLSDQFADGSVADIVKLV